MGVEEKEDARQSIDSPKAAPKAAGILPDLGNFPPKVSLPTAALYAAHRIPCFPDFRLS